MFKADPAILPERTALATDLNLLALSPQPKSSGIVMCCLNCEEKTIQEQHFYFKCTSCDTIECLPVAVNFTAPKGCKVEDVNSIVTGVCKTCA